MFSEYSHLRRETNKPKEIHLTRAKAEKAAASMTKRLNKHFSVYKCIYCDGYHLGKNRDNK